MRVQSSKNYSTKFVVLQDPEQTATYRKRRLIWICIALISTVVIAISVSYFCYEKFFTEDEGNSSISTNGSSHSKTFSNRSFNFKPWILTENQKRLNRDHSELICKESRLQAIPLDFILSQTNPQSIHLPRVHNFINLDLLLYYEDIINKYDRRALKLIFSDYHKRLSTVQNAQEFLNVIKTLKDSNKFRFYGENIKEEDFSVDLSHFKYYFELTEELNLWYDYLDRLEGFLSRYEQQRTRRDYSVNVTEINFNKFTKETQEKLFRVPHLFRITDKKLQEINLIIKEWMTPVKMEVGKSSVTFLGRVLLLSEVNRKLYDLDDLKRVFIFASRIVYLDEDVTLRGIDVAVIAPSWVFLRRVKIDLSGAVGEEHETDTAGLGKAGMPGNPGGNAGDFVGIGDFNEKFLMISTNGGQGGNGQNGAEGRQGIDYSRPGPPINKPNCVIKLGSFRNKFGQIISHYRIFGDEGCGGAGTDGGAGGEGGKGGKITLIMKEEFKTTKGSQGEPGSPGKGGAGGAGGRDGCFYEALDVDDEVLHCISTVKCFQGVSLPSGQPGRDSWNGRGEMISSTKETLPVADCFLNFIRLSAKDITTSFLQEYIQHKFFHLNLNTDYPLKLFNSIETFENFELYKTLLKFLQESKTKDFKHLQPILLGKMLILKPTVNYFFVDFNNYLSTIQKSLRQTNGTTREIPAITNLKTKIGIKIHKMKENFKLLKTKLTGNSSESLQEKRLSCITLLELDIATSILNSNRRDLDNFENLCSTVFDFGLERKVLSEDEFLTGFSSEVQNEAKGFRVLTSIRREGSLDKKKLMMMREEVYALKKSFFRFEKYKNVFEGIMDEVEHLIAVHGFLEWEELEQSFRKSLDESKNFVDSYLVEVLVKLQYKLGLDAARQRLYPFVKLDYRLENSVNKSIQAEANEGINELREVQSRNGFCQDTLEAIFDKSSAVGEFFYWANPEIKHKLRDLFRGLEINLKANLINHHVLDKNYVKFNSIKFEFESGEDENLFREIMDDFKMEITHSGYSEYNWRGETLTVVSEEITFDYSLKTRENGEPEVYNSLFKKCQNGEIMLSPYTTWRIRLLPINNGADYRKLFRFVDVVNLRLIGTGTFVS